MRRIAPLGVVLVEPVPGALGRLRSAAFAAVLALLVISGCGRVSGGVHSRDGGVLPEILDFLKTEIVDNGPVPADGSSELVVAIHLKNSNNKPVPNYKPDLEVASGLGVTITSCTTSDINGVAVCVLKATQAGVKRLRLANAKVGLEREVLFKPPASKTSFIGLASAGTQTGTTSGGYKIQVSVGEGISGIKVGTNGGYKAKLTVQGTLTK